ncbi:glycosyltransferase family 1 protein [Desulfovibrio sp. OttesenSCG-928-C06]|nr:glycosyltransferase family 1 protein [Desulfovibrio sp. OttesenSCG-928-C06]
MRTVFFIPPLRSLSGGLAAIYELAEILIEQDLPVAVTCPVASTPGFSALDARAERLDWARVSAGEDISPHDIWCIPEGWPNAIAPGVKRGAGVLVYVQNWIHLLNTLPQGVRWKQLPVRYLAVSAPVDWFMREVMELKSEAILPPAIADFFFDAGTNDGSTGVAKGHPGDCSETAGKPACGSRGADSGKPCLDGARASSTVRIAWMPRKNKALASQMFEVALNALAADGLDKSVELVEIAGKSRAEVAGILAGADIFLSTGFPEGFALPPLEAMACGAVPVGFSGQGGFEYMRNPQLPGLYTPPFPLEPKEWGANGLFVSDGDVMNGGLALARAVKMRLDGNPQWDELRREGRKAARAYGLKERSTRVAKIWPELIELFQNQSR